MSPDPVEQALERFFLQTLRFESGPEDSRNVVLVAFSGGPDSTALLAGLARVAPRLGLGLHAAHLDHGLDAGSELRARGAMRLAAEIGVPATVERLSGSAAEGRDGPEAAARRARYAFLERVADEAGARFVATAHHADDQAETLLLRLAFGSGVEGLRGIRPRRGRLVRPLLSLRRRELLASLDGRGIEGLLDPTNEDLTVPRNRFRRILLPLLAEDEPEVVERLVRLAAAAATAAGRVDELLAAHLEPEPIPHEPGFQVARDRFDALPESLVPHALALLHRRAGAPYPAGAEARRELRRQLRGNRGGRVGCDCGAGWRWEAASGVLQLARRESFQVEFAYTVGVPGEVEIPELGLNFRLRRGPIAPWMWTRCPDRAGLAEPPPVSGRSAVRRIEVRNRRPGDRMTPLGSDRRRRLKDLLIDRRVPRRQRDRLPLLVIDGEIAWVPGVAVAERYRLSPDPGGARGAWIAEIETLPVCGEESSEAGE